jgi:hypothetical protein
MEHPVVVEAPREAPGCTNDKANGLPLEAIVTREGPKLKEESTHPETVIVLAPMNL